MIKELKLGKKIIKIKVVQKIPGEPKSVLGVFDPGDRVIYLRKQDKNEMMYTLMHEIMHAYIWHASLHNFVKPNVEELVCDTFANAFIDLANNGFADLVEGVDNGKKK